MPCNYLVTGACKRARLCCVNAYVTWNLLSLLGVQPALGRNHVAEDAFPIDPKQFGQPNPDLPPGKVVLSYGLWQRRFGGDSSIIGRTIQLDGWGSEVVGVLPAEVPTLNQEPPEATLVPTV